MSDREKKEQEALGHSTVGNFQINPEAPLHRVLSREEDIREVFAAMYMAVYRSVGVDMQREPFGYLAQKGMTMEEMKRRAGICLKWVEEARKDRGYTVQKTIDLMPQILRCRLDGIDWDPDTSSLTMWAPT